MKIILDKIGSVTILCQLSSEVEVCEQFVSSEGTVLAARVLNEKNIYNKMELVTGRLATVQYGDIIAVALGARSALKGYVGSVPSHLEKGDIIQLLNIGGVAGELESANSKEVGKAFNLEVIGVILKNDQPVNIKNYTLYAPEENLDSETPLVLIAGTSMDSGKTTVASEIIKYSSRAGYKVHAAKMAGVAALRDTENMSDYGAKMTTSFLEAGLPSTVGTEISLQCTKGSINYLSKGKPDFIVIELGDGIYGEYGVNAILEDEEIRNNTACLIGCAYDPVGAVGLTMYGRKINNPFHIISGPVTDNSVGVNYVTQHCKIIAVNAFNDPISFLPIIENSIRKAGVVNKVRLD
ncbi:MAG: hypothetical protein D3923_10475 [Candidatus Electrothrix sp. AR3]|nr:hypothetical protein [Candidatus Electrothrix sp. AR3]